MNPPLIIPLADVRQADVTQVGGKAATLGELRRAGFPIPAGLCITTAAFRLALADRQSQLQRLLRQASLSDAAAADAIANTLADLLADLTLPAALEEALAAALPWVADSSTPLAVRSSATGEDGVSTSYAGQYATVLGVCGPAAVKQAILAGWRSFFSAHALAARAAQGALAANEGMALLLQPMIAAECAGVAFSVDPVQQRRDRLLINAAWGLGVGAVDGNVATDTVWLRRADLTVERRQIGEKREQMAHDDRGNLIKVSVPLEQQCQACLPPAWLERVAQFTIAVETQLGVPQDVEWAVGAGQLWLLQARPITGLPAALATLIPFPVTWQTEEERRSLWHHDRQGDEAHVAESDVQLPLQLDNARDIAAMREEGCRLVGAERNQEIKVCNGRVYVRAIPMPWTAADQRIRRAVMLDLRARLQEQGLTTWDHWGPEIVKATERLRAFDHEGADGPALADHLEEVLAVRRRHMPLHPAMDFKPPQSYYDAFAALSGLAGDEAEAVANRLGDSEETPLTHLIDGLYALALLARQEAGVAALVAQSPVDGIAQLKAMPQAAPFLAKFADLLNQYGERTGDGWGSEVTLSMATWQEDPATVLALIAPYLDHSVEAPAVARQRARQTREAEVMALCNACADPDLAAEFRRQLAYVRKVSAVVEQHNHYLDQMYTGQLRQAVMAAGRRLVAQGLLAEVDDLFWLHFAEIVSALRTPDASDLASTIATRQADYRRWQALDAPPILGMPVADLPARPELPAAATDRVGTDKAAGEPNATGTLRGLGASHGRYRGRARIATDPFILPNMQPGDILVAENVGPMWTPIFPILGGLVLERGSVGQHAAATAREYGVPVAIQVKDAGRYIADGSWITVDGQTGVVEYGASSVGIIADIA